MNKFFIVFLLILAYKLISNVINLIKIKYYKFLYDDFIENNSDDIFQHRNHVVELFKKANIPNLSYPITQYTGCNMVSNGHTSIFTTFPTKDVRFLQPTEIAFKDAIGIFRGRIFECFNPVYWIECILFLPKNVLKYLNVSVESILIKLCQLLYWLIGLIVTLFSTEISNFIKSFFSG